MLIKKKLILVTFASVVITAVWFMSCRSRLRSEGLEIIGYEWPLTFKPAVKGLVIVTHGWIEKGEGDWPEDMAGEIYKRVDPNLWLCGYFDWSEGAKTLNPTDAAEYARDVAGPALADEIIELGCDLRHIHLIGHSDGCWVISEAAKKLVGKTRADLHLTFLDAYIPAFWDESSLGDANVLAGAKYWAEHYYTRDYTLKWTQQDLSCAHNVDITDIDEGLKDHNFPWRWYYATVSGKYPKGYFLDDRKLVWTIDGIEYGFARSMESDAHDGWERSLKLPVANKAVKLKLDLSPG
jgi:hypothetical protein